MFVDSGGPRWGGHEQGRIQLLRGVRCGAGKAEELEELGAKDFSDRWWGQTKGKEKWDRTGCWGEEGTSVVFSLVLVVVVV